MGLKVQVDFLGGSTVRVRAYVYDDNDSLVTPTSVKCSVTDPDGVVVAGVISVVASASFTAGLVVTGATSGATGTIYAKPDATTLHLQEITGVWQSGEVITDTSTGTSTTSSALATVDMTATATGTYDYFYNTITTSKKKNWRGVVTVVDGTGATAKTSKEGFAFVVK